jgi:hypothetical protein
MSITKDQILEVLKMAVENSRRWYELGDSQMMPHWGLINTKTQQQQVIFTPWRDDQERQVWAASLREKCREDGIDLYWCAAETWIRRTTKEEHKANPIRPSEDPNRLEGVHVVVASADLWATKSLMIKRDDKGKVIDLIDDEENTMFSWEPGPSNASGWMMSLLRPMRAGANPVSSKPGDYIRPSNLQ